MQLIVNGPDLPEALLRAHGDGNVVFFTGAGISIPAGLPNFKCLVNELYARFSVAKATKHTNAIKAKQYDVAISLLEKELANGREQITDALIEILKVKTFKAKDWETHQALLTLSRTSGGQMRLITTNVDRLFELAIKDATQPVQTFTAPQLPIPKNHWDGLVYLHGLLPDTNRAGGSDRLVLSSGDFGLAYLTERWAARFVSELVRRYTLCFVGYSVSDPVMRYITDAVAADRESGEPLPPMFAFVGYQPGTEADVEEEWSAKDITPILYLDEDNHKYLHSTLNAWASLYRDGLEGKLQIINQAAISPPSDSTEEDDFVGRVIWAISDPAGNSARHFAELTPVPSISWLKPLSERLWLEPDAVGMGTRNDGGRVERDRYSALSHPTDASRAAPVSLVDRSRLPVSLDPVMRHLARWLARHVGEPDLVMWVVKQGGQLHPAFAHEIEEALIKKSSASDAGQDEMAQQHAERVAATPSLDPRLRQVWHLILAGRMYTGRDELGLIGWPKLFRSNGLSAGLRSQLRAFLTPCLALGPPLRPWLDLVDGDAAADSSDDMTALVDWKVRLRAGYVFTRLQELAAIEDWQSALPDLLDDFSSLLRDALDLMRAMGGAADHRDRSFIDRPSVTDHAQNSDYDEWVALIVLARDAWLAAASIQPERASLAAHTWWHLPYPCFKRLALFAAAQGDVISPQDAVDWLLDEETHWLWSPQVQREAMRLLVFLGPRIGGPERGRLEAAILRGPARLEVDGTDDVERRRGAADRSVWLRLIRLKEGDADALGAEAREWLASLEMAYPQWRVAPDDGDDFPLRWLDASELGEPIQTPYRCKELVDWLQRHPKRDDWNDDEWAERCRHAFPAAICALKVLAMRDVWVPDRWAEALNVWRDRNHLRQSWRRLADPVMRMPDNEFAELLQPVNAWLDGVAQAGQSADSQFLALVDRVFDTSKAVHDAERLLASASEPLVTAINHPIGHAMQALLRAWYQEGLKDGQGLRKPIQVRFEQVLNSCHPSYINGRVVLARNAITLFRVDYAWTQQNLLPRFDWQRPYSEAASLWQGLLSAGRGHPPMLFAMKKSFLETSSHYSRLGDLAKNYSAMLGTLALHSRDEFEATELREALKVIGNDGRGEAARAVRRGMSGSGDRKKAYFENRVVPFFNELWPQTKDAVSPAVAKALTEVCLVADESFPQAFDLVRHWLIPVEFPSSLVHQLREAGLCERFPDAALQFISKVLREDSRWVPADMAVCLQAISDAKPELRLDPAFKRLERMSSLS